MNDIFQTKAAGDSLRGKGYAEFRPGIQLEGESGAIYEVIEAVGGGGNGTAYKVKCTKEPDHQKITDERRVRPKTDYFYILKAPNFHQETDFSIFRKEVDLSCQKLREELASLESLFDADNIAHAVDSCLLKIKGESMPTFVGHKGDINSNFPVHMIVIELASGQPLASYYDLKNPPDYSRLSANNHRITANDLGQFFRLMQNIVATVVEIHDLGHYHGDLWPDNVFVTGEPKSYENNITLIDFGSSGPIRTSSVGNYSNNETRHTFKETGYIPLDPLGDIYSIGQFMVMLLTGMSPPRWQVLKLQDINEGIFHWSRSSKRITTAERMAECDQSHKWKVNAYLTKTCPTIVSKYPTIVDLISLCTRDRESRIREASSLMNELVLAARSCGFDLDLNGLLDTDAVVASIQSKAETLSKNSKAIWMHITELRLRKIRYELDGLNRGFYDQISHRDRIIFLFSSLLAKLEEDHSYWTFSAPKFWNPRAASLGGRVASHTLRAALRGAEIRRILLWSSDPASTYYADAETLEKLKSAFESLQKKFSDLKDEGCQGVIEVRLLELSDTNLRLGLRDQIDQQSHLGRFSYDGECITIRFDYRRQNAEVQNIENELYALRLRKFPNTPSFDRVFMEAWVESERLNS